jgi:hypothetical protein
MPPTATETLPPVLPTSTATALLPTATPTIVLPTATATPLPASPTPTATLPPPTATVTASPEPPEPTPTKEAPAEPNNSETIYDDKNNSFVYSGTWTDVNNKKAHEDSFKRTTEDGASVTFNFTGQSFSVLYKGGKAFRKMDVYIDGALVGTIDQEQKSAYKLRWDYPGQLASGNHTLKLIFVSEKTAVDATKGSLDAVIVR